MKRIGRIFLHFLASLLFVSLAVFLVVNLTPGDIAEMHNLSAATASHLHLDKPLPVRYLLWVWGCLNLDFGLSVVDGSPVRELLLRFAPVSLALTFGSVALSLLIAVPLGLWMGLRPDSRIAKTAGLFAYSVSSVPVFVLGYIVLGFIFEVFNFYSPTPPDGAFRFWPWFAYYILPVLVLAIGNGTLGEFARFISLEVRNADSAMYMKAARARGANLGRHFLRSLILPISSIIVTNLAVLLGGVVVVERIFNRHGLGWLSWEATLKRDFSVILGVALVMAVLVRAFMLGHELLAHRLDPRLRR